MRLTNGMDGYLEVYGYYEKEDRNGWFPVCVQERDYNDQTAAMQNLAKVVCRTLGVPFIDQFTENFDVKYSRSFKNTNRTRR